MQPTALYTRDDHRDLHNEPVMVNPGHATENPPVGMRGTIRVTADDEVEVVLQFAVMFDRPAGQETIRLSPAQVATLRASKARTGEYAITLDSPIQSPPVLDYVVASPRL
jgi:hypothetical protein